MSQDYLSAQSHSCFLVPLEDHTISEPVSSSASLCCLPGALIRAYQSQSWNGNKGPGVACSAHTVSYALRKAAMLDSNPGLAWAQTFHAAESLFVPGVFKAGS